MSPCEHLEFEAQADVHRLPDQEPIGFYVDLRVTCLGCREPLRFLCPDVGLLSDRPALSPDGLELRIPARASRDEPDPLRMGSFRITRSDA